MALGPPPNTRRLIAMCFQIAAEANCFARQNSLSPFVLYQGKWNLSVRDLEREIIREYDRQSLYQ